MGKTFLFFVRCSIFLCEFSSVDSISDFIGCVTDNVFDLLNSIWCDFVWFMALFKEDGSKSFGSCSECP